MSVESHLIQRAVTESRTRPDWPDPKHTEANGFNRLWIRPYVRNLWYPASITVIYTVLETIPSSTTDLSCALGRDFWEFAEGPLFQALCSRTGQPVWHAQ